MQNKTPHPHKCTISRWRFSNQCRPISHCSNCQWSYWTELQNYCRMLRRWSTGNWPAGHWKILSTKRKIPASLPAWKSSSLKFSAAVQTLTMFSFSTNQGSRLPKVTTVGVGGGAEILGQGRRWTFWQSIGKLWPIVWSSLETLWSGSLWLISWWIAERTGQLIESWRSVLVQKSMFF